ncbi:hypothetical protein HPB50_024626 [Hyalomma asiaticum]|uniref:Uncharacterized protein n=1 Tax=Hyalomma asiaticum TaxID=266040 RepID=A0ACB7SC24_HYAAI|nr:hypothetical protein HPB50_024626 [Hyalomma asiaticum]
MCAPTPITRSAVDAEATIRLLTISVHRGANCVARITSPETAAARRDTRPDKPLSVDKWREQDETMKRSLRIKAVATAAASIVAAEAATIPVSQPDTEAEKQVQHTRWRRSGRLYRRLHLSEKSASATRLPGLRTAEITIDAGPSIHGSNPEGKRRNLKLVKWDTFRKTREERGRGDEAITDIEEWTEVLKRDVDATTSRPKRTSK